MNNLRKEKRKGNSDRKGTTKMKNKGLLITAGIFLVLGLGSVKLSQSVMCIFGECVLITSGDNLLNAKGSKIDSGTASLIGTLPMITFGISGACLIAGLVKSETKS